MAKFSTNRIVYVLDDSTEFRESTLWLLESMNYKVEGFDDPIASSCRQSIYY